MDIDIERVTGFITNASPPVILIFVLNGVGSLLRSVKKFPNQYIPHVLFLLGIVMWPFVGEWSPAVRAAKLPSALMATYGGGIGLAAVGLYELGFYNILGVIRRFVPGLKPEPKNDPLRKPGGSVD